MSNYSQTPTAALRTALAAYRPDVPAWQQQRPAAALRRATAALAAKIAEWEGPKGKLETMWDWLDANPEHPDFIEHEDRFLAANDRYTAARDLLGEAELVIAGKETA